MNELEKKEIEEIAKYMCMGEDVKNLLDIPCDESCKKNCEFKEKAKIFINAGYHKTVWHRVADGDLPPANQLIKILLYTKEKLYVTCSYYTTQVNYSNYFFTSPNNYKEEEVIAWTELPKYEEGNE